MGTTLHELMHAPGAVRPRKRVGRGPGSGTGKTAGRGVKGQKARSGHHGAKLGFEGGQMPMQRRLPKRGFKNPFRREVFVVNVGDLAARCEGGVVDPERLVEVGLVPRCVRRALVKVLGEGEIPQALTVRVHAFSASAREKIAKAGGSAEVLAPRPAAGAPAA